MGEPLTPIDVAFAVSNRRAALRMLERVDAESSLKGFARALWPVLEPATPLVTGWVIDAVAEHLQAVTDGHLRKVLINVPPGFGKSVWTDVLWPAWEWGPRNMPSNRYVSASYSERLTYRDNDRCRWLIRSPEYQAHWGQRKERCAYLDKGAGHKCDCGARFHLRSDQDSVLRFGNDRMGWKLATSIGGVGTGERGDRWIIDDPHNVFTVESDQVRENSLRWFAEVVSSRTNSARTAFVLIMQRVHELDASSLVIARELGFTHLCVPMRYMSSHPHRWVGGGHRCPGEKSAGECCPPQFGRGDPRTVEGELAWPELFPATRVDDQEKGMSAWGGSYAVAGQMQQIPVPRGGGMFQRADFQVVDHAPAGRKVRRWDLAATEGGGDYTVGVLMSMSYERKIYVEDVVAGQWGPGGVEDKIVDTAHADGPGVPVVLPLDPGPGGKAWVAVIARRLHGYDVRGVRETGDKQQRARPLAAQCEAGNVHIVENPAWNTRYLSVMCSFPRGATDDEVDASSGAYNELVLAEDTGSSGAPILVDLGSEE